MDTDTPAVRAETPFFDAHAHVQFSAYDTDREAVIERARAAGVRMINVGTQIDTSKKAVELAEKHSGMYAAVGLHPIHTSKSYHDEKELGGGEAARSFTSRGEVFDMARYRSLAMHTRTVAIGECGLDYFRFSDDEPREAQMRKQREAFVAQIELARNVKKPLMIHCRDAFDDLISILSSPAYPPVADPGVIHFFTGKPEDAQKLVDLGFSFTFGGVVTFTSDYNIAIKIIPIERILSETDAPYVAPAPYRGKRNEPAYVVETVKTLAELKNVSPDEMRAQIWRNAQRIFKI